MNFRKPRVSKARREAEENLLFYLRFFKRFPPDSRAKFDTIIQALIEELKEMD
jgi:hypothetical protein